MLLNYNNSNFWVDPTLPINTIVDNIIKHFSKPGEIKNRENIYQMVLANFRKNKLSI
jgi:hypothetical protein